MVTGKDDQRIMFARGAVENFLEQRDYYPSHLLHLIIINHHTTPVLTNKITNVSEHYVSKTKKTLGDLRNIAISMVPKGSIWVTWDDDDIRSPSYIGDMYYAMKGKGGKCAMITNRFEHNICLNDSWVSRFETGFLWFMIEKCDRTIRFAYDSLDTNEDKPIKDCLQGSCKDICVLIQNNPKWYIRLIHNSNTSQFVDRNQRGPKEKYMLNLRKYHEQHINLKDRDYIRDRIKRIYPQISRECKKSLKD